MHPSKKKSLISLKKAQTSLSKIINMVEKDEYCMDIIVQNLAVIGLIKSSNTKLLETFLDNFEKFETNKDLKNQEIAKIFQLLQK